MSTKKENREADPSEEREYHSPSSGIFFKLKRLLYRDKSDYQKIEVIENEYFGRVLLLDDLVQTSERDEFFYHEMLVHPAFVSHPSPQSILVIGGGDGGALKEILRYPIEHACLVEIDQQVIDVSKEYFPWLLPSLEDGRTELIIADGSEFIEKTDKKFDIVFIDSSDPTGPSTSLHEKGFYENLKRCLNLEGIVVLQAGSPFYHLESIKKKDAFLKKLFKNVCFYTSPVPTYPGGSWCFVFLSDEVQPLKIKRDPPRGLKYFNLDIYQAAFSLPNFMKDLGYRYY
ncbi:MAG: polyamine aminopropyltransferase [Candidatus Aminicenantes bacterium]|nr:MAG: polyamine aminopropyltransferase [Candidatus Aminicenantes bacterium]